MASSTLCGLHYVELLYEGLYFMLIPCTQVHGTSLVAGYPPVPPPDSPNRSPPSSPARRQVALPDKKEADKSTPALPCGLPPALWTRAKGGKESEIFTKWPKMCVSFDGDCDVKFCVRSVFAIPTFWRWRSSILTFPSCRRTSGRRSPS